MLSMRVSDVMENRSVYGRKDLDSGSDHAHVYFIN